MAITKATEIAGAPDYPSRRLRDRERKVVQVAEQFSASTASDWDTEPTTIGGAIDALAAGSVASAEVSGTISSAEILALNGTPKTLIAAPGAGKVIVVEEIELFLDYNSAGYVADAGEDFTIQYSAGLDIATWDNDSDAILVGTADERRLNKPDAVLALEDCDNEAVQAFIATGEVITGDSPMKYRIKYRTVTMLT